MATFKTSTTIGGTLCIDFQPTFSDNKSVKWVENNLPLRRLVRHLVAKRVQLGFSMDNIKSIVKQLKEKTFSISTWEGAGCVQVWIKPEYNA